MQDTQTCARGDSLGRTSVPRRVVFVNRFFAPDISATSQMLTDLTRQLADHGVEAVVVCSRQRYDDPHAGLPARERIAGADALRVGTTRFGRHALIGRALDYASFYVAARRVLRRVLRAGDMLVVMTDPPLMGIAVRGIARRSGATTINWLQDLFPEVASRLGMSFWPRWFEGVLERLRDASLRSADVNVVIGHGMQEYLGGRGIDRNRLTVIENWADGELVRGGPSASSRLRSQLGLGDRFVVGYSGNLGRAHEFETLLGAARRLQPDRGIAFLMVGGGSGMRAFEQRANELGLDNVTFLPYRARDALSDSLAAANVHLVCLRPELEGLVVPSKFYGVLAAGRPVIFVGAADGELARVLRETGCGCVVTPGDHTALAAAIETLREDSAACANVGAAARAAFLDRWTATRGTRDWLRLFEALRAAQAPSEAIVHGFLTEACRR